MNTPITDRAEIIEIPYTRMAKPTGLVPAETARALERIAGELAEAGNALLVKFPKLAERKHFHAKYMEFQAMKDEATK